LDRLCITSISDNYSGVNLLTYLLTYLLSNQTARSVECRGLDSAEVGRGGEKFEVSPLLLDLLVRTCTQPGARRFISGLCRFDALLFGQYSLRLPTEGWPGWVGLGGWLRNEIVYLHEGSHPSQY